MSSSTTPMTVEPSPVAVSVPPTALIGQVTADLKAAVALYITKTPLSLATVGPMVVSLYDDCASYSGLTASDKVTILTAVLSVALQASSLPAAEVELITTVLTQVMPGVLTTVDTIMADAKQEVTTCCSKLMALLHC